MLVWLITVGERLPTDGPNERLLRTGTLVKLIVGRGHNVVWWTSAFDHVTKKHRFPYDTYIDVSERYRIWYLYGNAYSKNVSLRRMINHYSIAYKFNKYAQNSPQPDVILCSLPTLELSLAAVEYGNQKKVPVVLDVRDLWPDIFLDLAPKWARGLARLALHAMFQKLRRACSMATAIVGISPGYVNWGVKNAGRSTTELDRDFPLAYISEPPSKTMVMGADGFWRKQQISKGNGEFIICYIGNPGRVLKLEPVFEAARILRGQRRRFRFVICGNHEKYKNMLDGSNSVLLPGWIDTSEIWTLIRIASVGLLPYTSRRDFEISIPNKVIEYMSAGLPVLSSVRGELGHFIEKKEAIGMTYDEDDPATLVKCLCDLYDSPELLKKLSGKAYELYKDNFVAENVYNGMIDYLEKICRVKHN
jgi:glycosyltransferase involved in cell wall biosynthesis